MEKNKKDKIVEEFEARVYTESDFIADVAYVSKFYLAVVIVSAVMILAAIFVAVHIKVSTGLVCGMIAVVYYMLTVAHILKKRLGIAYTSTTGQLRITKFYAKNREEAWIPRRLLWLDVTEIENEAFECDCCKNIKTIHLPKTLKRIGKDAFKSCESLELICFEGDEEEWASVEKECELGGISVEFSDVVKYPDKFLERERRRAERAAKKTEEEPSATDEGENAE